MQFAYNLTRKESSSDTTVNEVVSIIGRNIMITLGNSVQTTVATILQKIDAISNTWRTEFSRTFSEEHASYITGVVDPNGGMGTKYNYTMVFYDATENEYYAVMGNDVLAENFTSVVLTQLATYYSITANGSTDHNVFLKSCVLEAE